MDGGAGEREYEVRQKRQAPQRAPLAFVNELADIDAAKRRAAARKNAKQAVQSARQERRASGYDSRNEHWYARRVLSPRTVQQVQLGDESPHGWISG